MVRYAAPSGATSYTTTLMNPSHGLLFTMTQRFGLRGVGGIVRIRGKPDVLFIRIA